jgi:FG-GAP repeat protein
VALWRTAALAVGLCLGAAPAAPAAVAELTVEETRSDDSSRPLGFLSADVEVPRGVGRIVREGRDVAVDHRGRCAYEIALGSLTSLSRQRLPRSFPLRARGTRPGAVLTRDGQRLGTPLRWGVAEGRDEAARIVVGFADVELPPAVARGFAQRVVTVYAVAYPEPHCYRPMRRRFMRVTGAIARSLVVRETGEYVPPPPAAFPPAQRLATAPVLTLRGTRRFDNTGERLAAVGDVDADGRADLAVSAMLAPHGRSEAGTVHVVLGPSATGTVELGAPRAGALRIDGPSGGSWLAAAAAAGDVDGDGIDDLLVGAARANAGRRRARAGRAFLVRGRRGFTGSVDLARPSAAAMTIDGAYELQSAGEDVAGAGDVNGDGIPDLAIAAPDDLGDGADRTAVYVVFGRRPLPSRVDLRGLGAGGLTIAGLGDGAEELRVAGAGDVNGDGLDDVAIALPFGAPTAGGDFQSTLLIVFGRRAGGTVDVRRLDGAGVRLDGARCDGVGSVAGAGDFNGDGFDDVIAGAPLQCDDSAQPAGGAYVVLGGPGLASGSLDQLGDHALRIEGHGRFGGRGVGASVAAAGDDNGDGLSDVAVNAPDDPLAGIYVVYGRRDAGRVALRSLGTSGRRVLGPRGRRFGESLAVLPDADGDGRGELVARLEALGRADVGGAAVVFSRAR